MQLDESTPPASLAHLPAVRVLRRVWREQDDADAPIHWRAAEDLPPAALMIRSPYDVEARVSVTRETAWTGSTIHLTETCDDDRPTIITDVATSAATITDDDATAGIHDRVADRELLPREHVADTTDGTADHLVTSRADHAIDLVGPVGANQRWHARQQTGHAVAHFAIDWETQQATCPTGKQRSAWKPGVDRQDHPIVTIRWTRADGEPCPVRQRCVSHDRPRARMVRVQPQFEALMAARERQRTEV